MRHLPLAAALPLLLAACGGTQARHEPTITEAAPAQPAANTDESLQAQPAVGGVVAIPAYVPTLPPRQGPAPQPVSRTMDPGLPKSFRDGLARGGLVFTAPAGFQPIAPASNPHMEYEHAARNDALGLELRWAVRTVDAELAPEAMFLVVALNVSNGRPGELVTFPGEAVQREFNADWGGVAPFSPRKGFGGKWKQGGMVMIKRGHTYGYLFFLYDEAKDGMGAEVQKVLSSLRFG